jgi:CRP-like cAMP-binding protein
MVTSIHEITPDILKDVALLRCFNEQELIRLTLMGEEAFYQADTNIVIEGDTHGGLFLLMQGLVGVYKMNPATSDLVELARLRAGQFFGEMSLIDEQPRVATVRALLETKVYTVPADRFQQFLGEDADRRSRFLEGCVRELARRLRDLDESYVMSQYQLWKIAVGHPEGEAA